MNLHFRHKIPFYLYTILWLVYLAQSIFFGEQATIAKILLMILLIWSGSHFFNALNHRMPLPQKALSILFVSYMLYGIVPIINPEVLHAGSSGIALQSFSYMKAALISILPVYSFCYFAKKGIIDHKDIRFISVIFLFIIIFDYYDNQTKLLEEAMNRGSSRQEFTNNVGYNFLYLIPYLYFFKRKYALPFMACIVIFLVIAMKRGAILIGIVCIILYFCNWLKSAKRLTKISALVGIVVIVICIGYFVEDVYQNSPYFRLRVEKTMEGNTSGRDQIATHLIDVYTNKSDMAQLIFGFGANGTIKNGNAYAHNDWLETLVNQGLVGVFMLFSFYVSLYLFIRKKWQHNETYNVFFTLFVILFSQTLFSMSICAMRPYTTLLLGCCLNKTAEKDDVIRI